MTKLQTNCHGFHMVKESRTKLQRVYCDPCLIKQTLHESIQKTQQNNKRNENRNSLNWCKLTQNKDVKTLRTITHNTTKEYGCLNMVPNQRQR